MNDWRHEFVLAARERRMGRTSELLRAVRAGDLIPVSRGVYRRASSRTTDPDRRADDDHLARVRAAQLRSSVPLTIAGMSAAAVWGLPVIGEWPQTVHVASPRAPGGRSNAHLTRSYVGAEPPITVKGGLTVTTLARTVAEVCRTESMERAVAVADAALRGADGRPTVSRADILRELDALGRAPGAARARGAVEFASELAESPGESCSRVAMWRLGVPAPILQQRFHDETGLVAFVDFWWPGLRVAGEFDGRGKYLREEFAHGRTTAEIVMDEKRREDRLRALGIRIVRWGWSEARSLPALERKLAGAGVIRAR